MTKLSKLGRRAFIGTGAVVVAGAGLVGTGALTARGRGEARFDRTDAYPDAAANVTVELPGARDGARGLATMFVVTPKETLSVELGEVTFAGGRASLEATLDYPYQQRVAGEYRYHVRVELGGRRAVTAEPATYSLRRIHWFS